VLPLKSWPLMCKFLVVCVHFCFFLLILNVYRILYYNISYEDFYLRNINGKIEDFFPSTLSEYWAIFCAKFSIFVASFEEMCCQ